MVSSMRYQRTAELDLSSAGSHHISHDQAVVIKKFL